MRYWYFFFVSFLIFMVVNNRLYSYPYDGYEYTGIRRLAYIKHVVDGTRKGTKPVPGSLLSISDVKLNLVNSRGDSLNELPTADPALEKQIDALFPNRDESYSLALLDITPGKKVRFASRQMERQFMPGSVGKLAIAAGLFTELKRIYPDSEEKRHQLLKTRQITADKWIQTDSHTVPVFDPVTNSFVSRRLQLGDVFSLYEWVDHMLSASANAAASVVWKELILMREFGEKYPVSYEQEQEYFKNTPKSKLQEIAISVVNDPLREIGIAQQDWQLGSFFTGTGKAIVPGTRSYGNPKALLQYLIALERGKIVDEWSSLQIKRLLYMTARRIRYASSPAIQNAAVYFKSGSQYKCKEEPDFKCGQYMGNVENYMNSVAIIEQPDGQIYLIALMSNVLRKNSAVEHQSLATFIDRIIRGK
ncbi:serine hydrolase [candidate division KSB1 bacterium]|nr:serine hydrolase [candidate division KSB1 bacterium]